MFPLKTTIIDGVSMYSHLLSSALDTVRPSEGTPRPGEALSELARCRTRLSAAASFRNGPDWALPAVADQLAYDVALVGLAQLLGIDVDVSGFDRPEQARIWVEEELASRGISLDENEVSPHDDGLA